MGNKDIKPANMWDDPETIKSKGFEHGIIEPGMTPAETIEESFLGSFMVESFSRLYEKYKAITHIHIDDERIRIPDVSFWEKDLYGKLKRPVVVIEIVNDETQEIVVNKCLGAISENGVKEGFVYVYDTGLWRKFTNAGEADCNAAFSDVLKLDLTKLLPERNKSV